MIRETQGNNGRCQKRECGMNGVDDKTRDAVIIIRLSSWIGKKLIGSKTTHACIIFYIIRSVLDWLATPVCSISYRGFDFDESPKWL